MLSLSGAEENMVLSLSFGSSKFKDFYLFIYFLPGLRVTAPETALHKQQHFCISLQFQQYAEE